MDAGTMVLYECNDGLVAYGPFAHVDDAIAWCDERKDRPGEDEAKFILVPWHHPSYWKLTQ